MKIVAYKPEMSVEKGLLVNVAMQPIQEINRVISVELAYEKMNSLKK